MKQKVKINIIDWWKSLSDAEFYNNYFIKLLSQKYEVIRSHNPDFIFYSLGGKSHLSHKCVRIFFTGENIRADYNVADYSIDFDFMEFGDRHLRLPLPFCEYYYDFSARFSGEKSEFCSFLVSNSNRFATFRNTFFHKLSKYKKVDSGGKYANNINYRVQDKIEWLQKYKFNICFENSSYPGYLSEKIFDAFAAGCVPIYWGDTSLRCGDIDSIKSVESIESKNAINTRIPRINVQDLEYTINPKAYINAHNFPTLDALVDEVKRLDNDAKAYNEMRNQEIFLNNFKPYEYYAAKTFAFLDSIISQGREAALRRGVGAKLYGHERDIRYAKIVNNAYKKIFYIPRNALRSFKDMFQH